MISVTLILPTITRNHVMISPFQLVTKYPVNKMRSKKIQSNRERGQSLVEFVMSITFMILLVAGVVDLGRGILYIYCIKRCRPGRRGIRISCTNLSK